MSRQDIAMEDGISRGALVNQGYVPRILDKLISEDVEDFGAVCIEGPKYCGKT